MKKIHFLFVVTLLLAFACKSGKQYSIIGEIDGIADGELVYLYNSKSRENSDSVAVTSGKFNFSGSVNELSLYYLVYTPANSRGKYKSVWIDNVPILIKGSLENFDKLDVTGTDVQQQENEFIALNQPLEERLDSVYRVYNPGDEEAAKRLNEVYENILEQQKESKVSFVKEHPDYFYSVFLLERLIRELDPEEGKEIYDALATELKSSFFAENIEKYLELNENLKIGDTYSDLTLITPDGMPVSLSEVAKDNFVLIDFWASWCNPCRKENPHLVKAYEKYKEKGFEIYAVSLDKKEEDWLKAVDEDGITWTTVIDTEAFDSESAMKYGVRYIPHNFLINPEGKIIEIDLRGEDFLNKMEEIFGE